MKNDAAHDWPGKADGVPRPPTPAELDDVSSQQAMITDEWGSEPAPSPSTENRDPTPDSSRDST